MSGYQRVTGTANPPSGTNGTNTKSATVDCPSGKKVVGGGELLTGSSLGNVNMIESRPADDDTWTVTATESGGSPSWAIQAYAVCVTAP